MKRCNVPPAADDLDIVYVSYLLRQRDAVSSDFLKLADAAITRLESSNVGDCPNRIETVYFRWSTLGPVSAAGLPGLRLSILGCLFLGILGLILGLLFRTAVQFAPRVVLALGLPDLSQLEIIVQFTCHST